MDINSIIDEGDSGCLSIRSKYIENDKEIKGIRAVREMELHRSDVGFFGMDKNGNEVED